MGKYYKEFDTTITHVDYIDSLDLNFDSINDLIVSIDYSNTGMGPNIIWDVYYFDAAKKIYIKDLALKSIPNPKLDSKNQFIYTLYVGKNLISNAQSYNWTEKSWVKYKTFEIVPSEDSKHISKAIFKDNLGNIIKEIFINENYPTDSLFR